VTQYTGALVLLVTAATAVLTVYVLGLLVAVARRPLVNPPYVARVEPAEFAVSRFHARWYALTMVFLAFDIEMLFMYPWTLVVAEVGATAVVEMFGFLAVLALAILYAWREGAFRWS
jgi:NADH-quinone oxidoreductase subunit A